MKKAGTISIVFEDLSENWNRRKPSVLAFLGDVLHFFWVIICGNGAGLLLDFLFVLLFGRGVPCVFFGGGGFY